MTKQQWGGRLWRSSSCRLSCRTSALARALHWVAMVEALYRRWHSGFSAVPRACGGGEKHHRRKLDAPSGTAVALAESINEAMGGACHFVYDRSQVRRPRDEKEIGISSVRGGTIVGEHDVIFAGMDEVVTLSHQAFSRGIFAKGALAAAKFLAGRKPGMYDMSDVIGL